MTKKKFPLIGIGASAGGLDAIQRIFDYMPENTGASFVIIQHLSTDYKSLMAELLAKHTNMKIFTAKDKQELEPNCIYLNQKDKNLHVKGNKLYLLDKGPKHNLNLPIDIFFHTLGEEYKENSVGIILSGTGSDGSRGIKTIKEEGGTVIVQEPSSAQFDGMPKSSIATNMVDFILAPEKVGEVILKISKEPLLDLNEIAYNLQKNESYFDKIISYVSLKSGINFKLYKTQTLLRRVEKRMSINNFSTIDKYLTFLANDPEEVFILKQDFLIGVTRFLRDKEAFDSLKANVIPNLFENSNNNSLRIWVAGCSTGEEAYSLAMLLDDYIASNNLPHDFKIFATDIDNRALSDASSGVYNMNVASEIDKKYLERYLIKRGTKMEFTKGIRQKIIFSNHDILKDPPFIRLDLITCRNLLIYLNREAQERVLKTFNFSLRVPGYLFLGSSENISGYEKLFTIIDNKWRIFENISRISYPDLHENININYKNKNNTLEDSIANLRNNNPIRTEDTYHKVLSELFSPSCIIIDDNFDILYIQGDAGKRLFHNTGLFDKNILRLVATNVSSRIRLGVKKLENDIQNITLKDITYQKGDDTFAFDINISKRSIGGMKEAVYILYFSEDKLSKIPKIILKDDEIDASSQKQIDLLEEELAKTKVQLQSVVEELETSNEELQSSNEELMSSNEELQSTNEELQSVNEELTTVNSELTEKNADLKVLNDDVSNLMESTKISTLFLDGKFCIRKYTDSLTKIFSIRRVDIKRPFFEINSNFSDVVHTQIKDACEKVVKDFNSVETEIKDKSNNYYLLRVNPFITSEKKVDGVVLTFVDTNKIKENENLVNLTTQELNAAQEIGKIGNWSYNLETGVVKWSEQLYRVFGIDPRESAPSIKEQEKLYTKPSWERVQNALKLASNKGKPYEIELEIIKKDNSRAWIKSVGRPIKNEEGKVYLLRGIAQDITEAKLLNDQLRNEKQISEKIANLSGAGIYIYDFKNGINSYINEQYTKILGWRLEEINAMTQEEFYNLFHPEDIEAVKKHIGKVAKEKVSANLEYRFKHKKGYWVWCYSVESPFEYDIEGNLSSMIGVFLDISERIEVQNRLKRAIQDANAANLHKNQFLANMSHEIRTPINGITGFADLLNKENLDPEKRARFVEIIKTSSNQLLNLVNDIIDISKIEVGELTIKNEPCHLQKLVENVIETFKGIISQTKGKNHLKLKLVKPKNHKDLIILTDTSRLQQILNNLITNSIKYSKEGTIEVGYKILKNQEIQFYVKDEGIGISDDKLTKIFKRFEQIEDDPQIEKSGFGLGLAIVKGILLLMNGSIKVASEFGKGSTFTFTIPLVLSDLEAKTEEIKSTVYKLPKGTQILVAEDNPINQEFFTTLLEDKEISYTIVNNGEEAVKAYKKNPNFDVILMDIRMPIMDGLDATKAILEVNKDAKIIAQTAFAMASDEESLKQNGFVDYIAKPIEERDLIQKINEVMNLKKKKLSEYM